MDAYSFKVGLVKIQADEDTPMYLTSHAQTLTLLVDGATNIYRASPEMDLSDLPTKSGAATSQEGTISDISISLGGALNSIAAGYPYNQIQVIVTEAELDFDFNIIATRRQFTGLVYQAKPKIFTGMLALVIKDWKYYLDIPGGMPCTENCYVKYFGDRLCQAPVAEYVVDIDSISGYDVTLVSVPSVVDFLFNKGYFRFRGTSIKIKHWESGTVFQTSEAMPISWVGQAVTVVAGCDKTLQTCRDIHNNEANFTAWGINMVDYNPQFEDNG